MEKIENNKDNTFFSPYTDIPDICLRVKNPVIPVILDKISIKANYRTWKAIKMRDIILKREMFKVPVETKEGEEK